MDVFKTIDQFISDVDKALGVDDVFDLMRNQIERLGFNMFTYWLMVSPDESQPINPLWVSSYPKAWGEHYLDNDFGAHDLVVRNSAASGTPFLWQDLNKQYKFTKSQRLVFDEGREIGIQEGGTVPIHGPGKAVATFSVANDMSIDEFFKLFNSCRHELHILATYAHEKIIKLGIGNIAKPSVRLTAKEIEVLTWVARGKTSQDVGDILSISDETVNKHVTNIMNKLDVLNRVHAVSKAVLSGLIQP